MRMSHDRESGALYFRLREGEVSETLELQAPGAYMDVDQDGNVVGLEFLSLEEFLFYIDSAKGEVAPPDQVEPEAYLEPTDRQAAIARDLFKEWMDYYWRSYLEQNRTMRHGE